MGPGGSPIRVGGTEHRRGLVLTPRTVLRYTLPASFELFVATVGMEDRAGPQAHAELRITGDGRVLAALDLAAGKAPRELRVPIRGVTRLAIEIDFGRDLDLGDLCAVASPRLMR
jgi:hypothetical protein